MDLLKWFRPFQKKESELDRAKRIREKVARISTDEFLPRWERYLGMMREGLSDEAIKSACGFSHFVDIMGPPWFYEFLTEGRIAEHTQAYIDGIDKRERRNDVAKFHFSGELRRVRELKAAA